MSSPTTRQAYPDIYALLDRALESPAGIRIKVADHDKAVFLRMRIHQARQIVRNDNAEIYSPGDPLYAASEYDRFQIRIRADADADCAWVFIEPRTADILAIETLTSNLTSPELLEWNNEEPNSPPILISPSGIAPLPKRLEYSSKPTSEPNSSKPSTTPELEPTIPGLRRL